MDNLKLIQTEDNSHTLYNAALNETYHSFHGAIQESQHVFIREGIDFFCTQLKEQSAIKIFEVGFGTGLNALLTQIYSAEKRKHVQYTSIEAFPLSSDIYQSLNYPDLIDKENAHQLFLDIHQADWGKEIHIDDYFSIHKIASLLDVFETNNTFNVVYYDAFAPSKQPEMWTADLMRKMHDVLDRNGVFVTYCAKGQLKRDLKALGFEVQTIPGPPGKKEMVRAIKY